MANTPNSFQLFAISIHCDNRHRGEVKFLLGKNCLLSLSVLLDFNKTHNEIKIVSISNLILLLELCRQYLLFSLQNWDSWFHSFCTRTDFCGEFKTHHFCTNTAHSFATFPLNQWVSMNLCDYVEFETNELSTEIERLWKNRIIFAL